MPQEQHSISQQSHVWNVEVGIYVLEEKAKLNPDLSQYYCLNRDGSMAAFTQEAHQL